MAAGFAGEVLVVVQAGRVDTNIQPGNAHVHNFLAPVDAAVVRGAADAATVYVATTHGEILRPVPPTAGATATCAGSIPGAGATAGDARTSTPIGIPFRICSPHSQAIDLWQQAADLGGPAAEKISAWRSGLWFWHGDPGCGFEFACRHKPPLQ